MTNEAIIKDIKAGRYAPIYFICGEEPFFIDSITDCVENILPEDAKAFNQTVVYGNDVNMTAITDMARRFPIMSDRQVVIVKEAQNIKDFDNLSPYIDHFQASTILLFAYKNKKGDKRKSVFKKLASSKNCLYFEATKLYDNQLPAWIMDYCKSKQIDISPKAVSILAESLGTDLSRVVNEIDKLTLLVKKGQKIDEKLVEEHTGISKDFNTFELQSAITKRDVLKANQIVNYFESNPKNNPLVLTIATLFRYFLILLSYHYHKTGVSERELAAMLGVNPFFMKDYVNGSKAYNARKCAEIISLLREYDMKSKGVGNAGTSDGELLRELVFKIMH
ncbi:MAG: DNA polymerase III subunit delta [Culturomica sp.]|jgi:DNA polymerase-3 subunit delta|nr:DNA polymerase III subunit delta [Culturomica sp.]